QSAGVAERPSMVKESPSPAILAARFAARRVFSEDPRQEPRRARGTFHLFLRSLVLAFGVGVARVQFVRRLERLERIVEVAAVAVRASEQHPTAVELARLLLVLAEHALNETEALRGHRRVLDATREEERVAVVDEELVLLG